MKTTKEQIEMSLPFTREQYEEKRLLSSYEYVDFDDFLNNVAESVNENNGTLEDATYIANDAFNKL